MNLIKTAARKLLETMISVSGYEQRVAFLSMDIKYALKRVASRNLEINTIIDVGASNGSWSKIAKRNWRKARCLLVEANEYHLTSLQNFTSKNRDYDFVLAAASENDGTVVFDDSDPFGGAATTIEGPAAEEKNVVKAISLDSEVERRELEGPYLLKLDTHGHEIPILKGAKEILKNSNLVVIEAYNFKLREEAVKFERLCLWMQGKGFSVVDIAGPLWRPKDGMLWQFDLVFQRQDRQEFLSNTYE